MTIHRRRNPSGRRSHYLTAEFRYQGKLHKRGGFVDRESAQFWIDEERKRLRRSAVGYIKPMLKKPIAPLIEEFGDYLRAKGCAANYAYIAERRLERLIAECGWKILADATALSLEAWKHGESKWKGRAIGARTKNQFLQIAAEFGVWLVKSRGLLPLNPLADVPQLRAKHNDAYRRAGTPEELNKLLATCPAGRRLAYTFALYVPIRRATVEALTYRMLHLDATPPYGITPAELNKSRRDEKFPVRFDLAQQLRKARSTSKAKLDDLVFPDFPSIGELREDLERAGVPFDHGRNNRRLDLHAFRKTVVRWCKSAGISTDTAGLLLHHKDPRTTRKHYDDDSIDPVFGDAVERLPAVGRMKGGAA